MQHNQMTKRFMDIIEIIVDFIVFKMKYYSFNAETIWFDLPEEEHQY